LIYTLTLQRNLIALAIFSMIFYIGGGLLFSATLYV